jgi:hypothetical protein
MMVDRDVSGPPALLHEDAATAIFARRQRCACARLFPFVEPGFELDIQC